MPTRWKDPYIPLARADAASVRALRDPSCSLPDEDEGAIVGQPTEWAPEDVFWSDENSVRLTGSQDILRGRVWTDWPWGLFTTNRGVTVVHPLGAIQGSPTDVRKRMETIKEFLPSRHPHHRNDLDRADEAIRHLIHLESDTTTHGCPSCTLLASPPVAPNETDAVNPTTARET